MKKKMFLFFEDYKIDLIFEVFFVKEFLFDEMIIVV